MRISFALKIVGISVMNISTSNQRDRADLCGVNSLWGLGKTMLAMPKSCSSMTWPSRLARMNNWMRSKRGIIEFMNRKGKSLRRADAHPSWNGDDHLCDDPQIRFKTRFTNTAKDHRIRLLVKLIILVQQWFTSIYEVVTRPNKPAASWENPENSPTSTKPFVSLYDDVKGWLYLTKDWTNMKSFGDDTIAVTLLRASGGTRWLGLFPNTQKHNACRGIWGECTVECHQAQGASQPFVVPKPSKCHLQLFKFTKQEGSVAATGSLFNHPSLSLPQVCPTAFKVAENEEGYVLGYYNMSQENVRCLTNNKLFLTYWNAYPVHSGLLAPQEIRTELDQKEEI